MEVTQLQAEISEAMGRITALLDSARQYSQLDRAAYQRTDLRVLLDSTLTMLKRKFGEGVTVKTVYDEALPPVPVYAAELNQVWTNLIVNALYAMRGSGTLTIRTARENDYALVEIGDTGEGIPEENLGRIFTPFFTTKPVGQGTGLGLDISWRIVAGGTAATSGWSRCPATPASRCCSRSPSRRRPRRPRVRRGRERRGYSNRSGCSRVIWSYSGW